MPAAGRIHAPGRVNLIGDHTDYTGGLVLPMAIDRGTTLTYTPLAGAIELTSDQDATPLAMTLPFRGAPADVQPAWGSFVAAMAVELGASDGFRGHLESTIPTGAGLSSSAALECAIALALGFDGEPVDLARAAQRAEHAATGVPTGIMDQLCIAAARAGHATLIDCHTCAIEQVPIPDEVDIVVRFVARRTLKGSEYATRVAECARAEAVIGPLRSASPDDVHSIEDPVARRRARHVVGENRRVRAFASALAAGDYPTAGQLMVEGHESLRTDFETSTAEMDAAVAELGATPGVFGARMTGGGFGGCVVALAERGAVTEGWIVRPVDGARRA